MQWCDAESNKILHKQPLLTGGAGGAHATKRKRRWHTQHQNEHQNSLANTLLTVLQQWQQNPGSQGNDNEHSHEPRRKRNRPDWQYQDEWNSYYSWPNLSQGQVNKPHTGNDSSLAATLLDVIQQTTGKSDQEVAKTVQHAIHTHLHGADSMSPHPEYHQTGHREVSYKPSHTSNRWNKQAPGNPVHQLAPAEWTLPPRLGNYTATLEAIKQSQEIKHNMVEVQQAEHLDTLRTFWTAHECPTNITVICSGSAYHTEGNTFSTAKVTRKHQQQRIENISICAFGSKEKCPWPTPSITFASKDIPKVQRSTLRVAAPTEYRSGFVTKDSTFRIVTDIANWKLDIPTASLSGGTWSKQWNGHREIIVGFLKLPQTTIDKLLLHSGKHGIFFNQVDEANTKIPIEWFHRDPQHNSEQYLQKCQEVAQTRKQQLLYRKNGNNNIGVIPTDWEQEEVSHLLSGQGWEQCKILNRRRKNRHVTEWTILAQPPKSQAGQESWHFTDPENNANIHVVQAPPRRGKTFWQENIQTPTRAWTPPISATSTGHHQKSRRNPDGANSGRHDNEEAKEQDRERSPRRNTATVSATQIDPPTQVDTEKAKYLPEPSTVTEAFAAGWEERDLKGN